MLKKILLFCLLAKRLKRKQEFERIKTRKARSLGVLALLKSPFPIKVPQAIYSSKTHFKTSQALAPIVLLKIHQVEKVKHRQCEMFGGGISFQSRGGGGGETGCLNQRQLEKIA